MGFLPSSPVQPRGSGLPCFVCRDTMWSAGVPGGAGRWACMSGGTWVRKSQNPVGGGSYQELLSGSGPQGQGSQLPVLPRPSLARLGEEWPPAAGPPSRVSGGGTCTALPSGPKQLSHGAPGVVTRVKRGPTSLALGWREGGLGQWPGTPQCPQPLPQHALSWQDGRERLHGA